jgi:hypothetical protein
MARGLLDAAIADWFFPRVVPKLRRYASSEQFSIVGPCWRRGRHTRASNRNTARCPSVGLAQRQGVLPLGTPLEPDASIDNGPRGTSGSQVERDRSLPSMPSDRGSRFIVDVLGCRGAAGASSTATGCCRPRRRAIGGARPAHRRTPRAGAPGRAASEGHLGSASSPLFGFSRDAVSRHPRSDCGCGPAKSAMNRG